MTDTTTSGAATGTATADATTASRPIQSGEDIRADHVEISQGGANSVHAQTVSIQQGGAGQVRAGQVSITQGGVGLARTDRLELGEGGSAFAVVAREATVREGANVFLFLARRTSGEVRPLLDWRGAAAIGGALIVLLTVLRRGR